MGCSYPKDCPLEAVRTQFLLGICFNVRLGLEKSILLLHYSFQFRALQCAASGTQFPDQRDDVQQKHERMKQYGSGDYSG